MSNNDEKPMKKKSMINMKDMDAQDWRGLLAALVIAASFILLGIGAVTDKLPEVAAVVSPMIMMVLYWYYQSKADQGGT